MKPLTIQDVRKAVAGKALAPLAENAPPILSVSTDSRMLQPSSVFVAIKGERYDGHQYLRDVAAAGAVAAIIQTPPTVSMPNLSLIQVPDTRMALGKLASFVRTSIRATVVGVAGSNGKTGTKHLIDAALNVKLRGTYSPKSFNNDIGVPLAIFPADPQQDYLILEMGTNNPGEIRTLTTMATPDIAVITNCSAEHLMGLGDLIGVRQENASMIEGLDPERGLLVVNGDDPELLSAVSHWKGRRITFGFKPSNDLFAAEVEADGRGVRFCLNGNDKFRFDIPLLGRHTACNALAAIAVARRLGLTEAEVAQGLSRARGPDMRLQLQTIGGVTLLNDAYNANPASMRAALETIAHIPTRGRRFAVLADMLELGRSSERFHREAGPQAAQAQLDGLICVGPQSRLIAESAIASGMDAQRVSHFADAAQAAREIVRWFAEGDLVLLKGSRGMKLETLAAALGQERQPLKLAAS